MANPLIPTFILSLLLPLLLPSSAQTCNPSESSFSGDRVFAACQTLSQLGAALHWTYHPSNGTVDLAYRATQSATGWVAWAINPTFNSGNPMAGCQALMAFPGSNGAMTVFAVAISNTSPTIQDGKLSFPVYSKSAEYSNSAVTIYGTIGLTSNKTQVNMVWQAGTQFASGVPSGHNLDSGNRNSYGTLDFATGVAGSAGDGNARLRRKNTHGVLNAVSWGILMPLGAIIARYLRVFKSADPAWFYLHVACQCSAYILGVAGWGTGLSLGNESPGITYHAHRTIGITLFCLATLQVFALFLRPNKDNKYRIYWNVYHHGIGYTVLILSVINIFKGFDILLPGDGWKNAYIAVISTLAGIALLLEVGTWAIVLKRRSVGSDKSHDGVNGPSNGYGRQQV